MVESPPARSGEIKIGLFITPILKLKGRVRSQTVNCQAVNCQLLNQPRTKLLQR
ncbi:hypothetical protein [Microcoleus sp. CAWBG58]|uniref:hypothetical protein n=1 Tax=Microcoleus sp. CAWBG58 TaxID=2841651 RepID=UPI0025E4BB35|nr:hypothetical protein [Microcoleus sp. CAWBG58]